MNPTTLNTYCNNCGLPYTGSEGYVMWTCTACLTAGKHERQALRLAMQTKLALARLFRSAILEAMEGLVTQEIVERDVRVVPTEQEWVDGSAALEICCESGIMNASDVEVLYWDGREIVVRYADTWDKITAQINKQLPPYAQVHYEPYNSAIVGVYFD
jgi:hypothetical protein